MSSRFLAFLTIIRPVNSVMMGLGVVLSEIIAFQGIPSFNVLFFGFLTAFCLTASSMVLNDYFDFDVDLVNAPWRPLPSGLIKKDEATLYFAFLTFLGVASSLTINVECFLLACLATFISSFYNARGKKYGLLGNFMVSFCVALPFLFGSIAIKSYGSLLLQIFSLAAFLSNTGREVMKGIVDVEGDKVRGVRTVAMVYGNRVASIIAFLFFMGAIVVGFLPILFRIVSWLYLPFYIMSCIGFVLDSLFLMKDPSPGKAKTIKSRILIYMLLAMLAAFLGGFLKVTVW
ncbi:MAG: UbiA family prenyltransferase [archaeon GB-1867-035]|nr:UbiA family prenyltransferase [Candidatus Culexmicrobium profundum]